MSATNSIFHLCQSICENRDTGIFLLLRICAQRVNFDQPCLQTMGLDPLFSEMYFFCNFWDAGLDRDVFLYDMENPTLQLPKEIFILNLWTEMKVHHVAVHWINNGKASV